jgi:hypothetical protein
LPWAAVYLTRGAAAIEQTTGKGAAMDVKSAVARAIASLHEVYGEADLSGLRLEEVELSDDGALWHIALSFLAEVPPEERSGLLAELRTPNLARQYKILSVSSSTGKVNSMKIRVPA